MTKSERAAVERYEARAGAIRECADTLYAVPSVKRKVDRGVEFAAEIVNRAEAHAAILALLAPDPSAEEGGTPDAR